MKITDKDVIYVADLANLELTTQERERLAKDLNSILDYIDRLNELDTTDVSPMTQSLTSSSGASDRSKGAWREDELLPCLPREDGLQNAPETDGRFFMVPKVIEK
jgi:aspartyl-tRNA(Asn)/glutamyl-tRNA(Gln) amidotransferase subunit C